ncbi:MAG: MMPL domain-containing protein [Chloroflexi bacterium]|nr:MMPL domain-containing protein [Chloroflexota bacterium]
MKLTSKAAASRYWRRRMHIKTALNLSTENLARASANHPWRVVGIWVVVLAACVVFTVSFLENGLTNKFVFTNSSEVKVGIDLLEDEIRGPTGTNEVVVFESTKYTVDDPEYREAVETLTANIAALGNDVIRLHTLGNFYSLGESFLVSENRGSTLIAFVMAGDFDHNSNNIDAVVDVVRDSAEAYEGEFVIKITGQSTIGLDNRELSQEDLEKGESFGVPIALIILIIVLGAVAAALVPLVMAIVSIVVAIGISALVGTFFELSLFVTNIITMIGLAVGIDYSLFVVSRYREERGRGMEKVDAIAQAGATAGRAVVFSGMTVVLALIGMLLIPFNIFISIGLGAIFVVLAAMTAAMTLLPAILGIMGDKLNAIRVPFIGRGQVKFEPNARGGFWDKLVRMVMAQPIIALLLTGGLLIALIIPFFTINTGFAGISTYPDDLESKQAFLTLEEKFSFGEVTPAEIVIRGDIESAPVQVGIERLKELLASDVEGAFGEPRDLVVSDEGKLALLAVPVAGDTSGEFSIAAVTRLDEIYVEEAFANTDTTIYVTGETAFNIEFFSVSADSAWIVFPFVLGISFLLLLVVFRSIVLPIKAIILNLMAVGSAYGVLVLVFQEGFLAGFFGLQESRTIESWIPLFLFTILFGLSMDYHVFLLSRIREHYDASGDTNEAVAFGIRCTGRLITGAALIMVAVFWGFSTGSLVGLQQMGFGLGLAILLDATIVRCVMVPASMTLLGKWNWYLPGWLEWVPNVRFEPAEPSATVVPAED